MSYCLRIVVIGIATIMANEAIASVKFHCYGCVRITYTDVTKKKAKL